MVRGDTRERIQQVALELFTERGYDRTSLRDIAERLDVTKAALYYHFPSKDDIIRSMIDDLAASLDELLAWGRARPRPLDERDELLRRLGVLAEGQYRPMMHLMHQNMTRMADLGLKEAVLDKMKGFALLLAPDDDDPEARLRVRLALVAVMSRTAPMITFGLDSPSPQIALEVAQELAASPDRSVGRSMSNVSRETSGRNSPAE